MRENGQPGKRRARGEDRERVGSTVGDEVVASEGANEDADVSVVRGEWSGSWNGPSAAQPSGISQSPPWLPLLTYKTINKGRGRDGGDREGDMEKEREKEKERESSSLYQPLLSPSLSPQS